MIRESKKGDSLGEVHGSVNTSNKTGWRKLGAFIGPAYLVSVGYMDHRYCRWKSVWVSINLGAIDV